MFKSPSNKILPVLAGMLAFANLSAQQQNATPVQAPNSVFTNGVFLIMLAIIIMLLLIIFGMAEVVKAGGMQQRLKAREEKNPNMGKTIGTIVFLLMSYSLFAQSPATAPAATALPAAPAFNYWNMGAATFYIMLAIIVFESLIILVLFRSGMKLLKVKEMKMKLQDGKEEGILDSKLMKSLMDAVPVEEEEAILMDHDYDGIRELDNNLPPWWKYGFILTIVIGVIYLFNFHILHTGKLSADEYLQEIKEGDEQVAAYKAANKDLVDENSVVLLTDANSLSAGKNIFMQNCTPCHGMLGEGKPDLGPNFTDDYWIHGGSVQSVFKSVKYGWTEKGMKSWQQDLKPIEIQEVVSYVKSLRGTNPPNAKPPQGDLYVETGAKPIADSAKADSTKPKSVKDSVKK